MKRILLSAAVVLLTSVGAQAQTKRQLESWGEDCMNKHRWECAENAYRKLVEKETDSVVVSMYYVNLGYICVKAGRLADAMEYYTTAIDKNPGNWQARSNMGIHLVDDERYPEAVDNYTKAIEVGADDDVRSHRASVYCQLAMWDEAAEDYRYLMTRNPSDHEPVLNLARVMISSGDYERAAEYADETISLNGNSSAAYIAKGTALLNMKDKAGATEAFEKARELGSDNPALPRLLGQCE